MRTGRLVLIAISLGLLIIFAVCGLWLLFFISMIGSATTAITFLLLFGTLQCENRLLRSLFIAALNWAILGISIWVMVPVMKPCVMELGLSLLYAVLLVGFSVFLSMVAQEIERRICPI